MGEFEVPATRPSEGLDLRTDEELAGRAASGDVESFEQLYQRHSAAAWRVAQAVTGNRDDAADAVSEAFTRVLAALPRGYPGAGVAFRPYLLVSTRNAAIDCLRRSNRVRPTDDVGVPAGGGSEPTPPERLVAAVDAELVSRAFRDLPERWRSVLWLTEVEGIPPREVAQVLGLSANGAAQLAVRARAGLRERYLQAHLRATRARECRFTIDHLGAYVTGGLSPRDVAQVDQHLASCDSCRARRAELEDVRSTLRRTVLPIPAGVGALSVRKWRQWLVAGASRPPVPTAGVRLTSSQRLLAGASAGLFALGLLSAVTLSPDRVKAGRGPAVRAQQVVAAPAGPSSVGGLNVAHAAPALAAIVAGTEVSRAAPAPPGPPAAAVAPSAEPALAPVLGPATTVTAGPAAPGAPSAPAVPGLPVGPALPALPTLPSLAVPDVDVPDLPLPGPDEPLAQVGLDVVSEAPAAVSADVGVGNDACTGVTVGSLDAGCTSAPTTDGITVTTEGQLLPEESLSTGAALLPDGPTDDAPVALPGGSLPL